MRTPTTLPRQRQQAPEYLLLPVNPVFIWTSLAVAMMLNLLPWGQWPAIPDFAALTILFWGVHQPRRVGMGAAFGLGLLMDVHSASLLGEHALVYTLVSYFAILLQRRLPWFGVLGQALHVLPLLLIAQGLGVLVHSIVQGGWPDPVFFLDSVSAACLWPLVPWLLQAPQRRPVDRDDTRPL